MIPILSPEGLASLVFLGCVAATIAGALLATNAARLIRAVSGLALCMVGVAGIYYFLGSPFVALMQILIYAGAVCVTIIFAIMLAEPHELKRIGKVHALAGPASIVAAAILTWGLAALATKTAWQATGCRANNGALEEVGQSMLTTYSMSFELISVVLLIAIIGSLVLARAGRSK
ncbi:MAG TPA: NADH-quinone oxidoreductase subunit J [Desulfurivibrionaceae bacterium]|nr:NADH-quinone oxidoreductase subunit J [Desulfurivibrionaceae bacterium]